ncbi:NAD(P)-dependent dehydrogenase (short-subunit alcohol dehydrogenase family) [Azospirillum brasilense]|uniref:NAD(P)-dependent dehydrogenase (Short-subunit alcohol dehydrogenase family) n=1 Tax=Azospirillum brasilense TaxID=192 RepID=A0A560CRE3_AZOBR|nr:SDR family oxidoreductase [Azospirillum brasilense]TWA87430.1 NAD(P)-dependent dehydrogenase (short-subunit alcohol dehydrogenase family) [Azospirillum brasilense]
MTPLGDLSGRHVLVTGASSGIGRATAATAASLGARVTLNGRDEGRLSETLARLDGHGHRIAAFDLSDVDSIPGWVKLQAAEAGPIDGLAHCAGVQIGKPVRSVDQAFFDTILHANLLSALALARGLRQKGCHADRAALVLVSSVAAEIGQPGNVVYSAAKGGLVSATRGLAMEFLRDGIRVNCVAPAMVETEMMERFRQTTTAEQFEAIRAAHPMGFGKPEDVASAIAFLLSDAARWINGVTLPVDGGYLAK